MKLIWYEDFFWLIFPVLDLSKYILYEDNHILVCIKTAGLPTQSDNSGDSTLVDSASEYIRKKYNKPGRAFIGLVHRLDRPVSGVMLIAKTSKAAGRLSRQFAEGNISKYYLAWVEGKCREYAELNDLLRRRGKLSVIADMQSRDVKRASLRYKTLVSRGGASLILIRLITGRHHQIRVQLSHAGHPVFGDSLYGSKKNFKPGKIALHACALRFIHPVKKEELTFTALPEFWPSEYRDSIFERGQEMLQEELNFFK